MVHLLRVNISNMTLLSFLASFPLRGEYCQYGTSFLLSLFRGLHVTYFSGLCRFQQTHLRLIWIGCWHLLPGCCWLPKRGNTVKVLEKKCVRITLKSVRISKCLQTKCWNYIFKIAKIGWPIRPGLWAGQAITVTASFMHISSSIPPDRGGIILWMEAAVRAADGSFIIISVKF